MEVLQIFNRRTGIWSHRIILTAGYTEIFVLDKSTDSAEVKWWEFTDSEIEPPYQDDDWVLMMHVEEKNDPVIFNADGTTENATQYIIKSISKDYDEGNGLWKMSCALEEPIERFKRIVGETLSFTNQTSKTYDAGGDPVTYYKEPYNYYNALRRWLMVTPANCDTYERDKALEVGDNTNDYPLMLNYQDITTTTTVHFSDGSRIEFSKTASDKVVFYHKIGSTVMFAILCAPDETPYPYTANAGTITGFTNYAGINRQCCLLNQGYVRSSTNKSWYNRVKILDAQWLRSVPFADDTWNEMDLYRILFDKYDPLGKTPVIYFDLNPDTTLPNNMARDEYILKFERQDGFDKPVIDFDELLSRKPYERLLSYTVTKDNSTNITGLVCNAENLSSPTVVHYPAQGLFAVPEVDSNTRSTTGYTAQGDNWIIKLPFPIKKVNKLIRNTFSGIKRDYVGVYGHFIERDGGVDLTANVLTKQQYQATGDIDSALDAGYGYIWYEEGDNTLHIRHYRYIVPNDSNNSVFVYYIEYEPLPSARLLIGNEEKTQQINQTSSQIDAESFGRFADSYLKGSNKADITIGKLYAGDYEDFSDLIGSRVKRGDKTYMITQVAYRNIGMDGYNVFMQLNENHMRKNASYSAPQEIRANTAIATSNLKNRLTAIKQVVKVGFSAAAVADNDSYQFLTDKKIALSALCPTQIDSKYYPQVALFKGRSTLYTDAGLTNTTQFNVTRLATIAKVVTKNQVNLITTFYDNAEAGKRRAVQLYESGADLLYQRVKAQIPELFTDPFGESQTIELKLTSLNQEPLSAIKQPPSGPPLGDDTTISGIEFNRTFNLYERTANLPLVDNKTINDSAGNISIQTTDLIYFKDTLEKFNVNTCIEYVGENCIICQDLATLSRLLNQTDMHTLKVWIKNSGINEYDTFTDGAAVNVSSTTTQAGYIQLNLASAITGATGKTLIISTNTNKPLIIYNDINSATAALLADSKVRVYFN